MHLAQMSREVALLTYLKSNNVLLHKSKFLRSSLQMAPGCDARASKLFQLFPFKSQFFSTKSWLFHDRRQNPDCRKKI